MKNKKDQKAIFSICIENGLKDWLDEQAKDQDRSRNYIINKILEKERLSEESE